MFGTLARLFYSLVSFLVATFFVILGILCLILPFSPAVQADLTTFISNNSIAIGLFGFAFLVIGVAAFCMLLSGLKQRWYYASGGSKSVAINEQIIRHYVETYWKQRYPLQEIPTRLVFGRNKIKVIADLPSVPTKERKATVQEIQQELQELFLKFLGYSKKLVVGATFRSKDFVKPNEET